MTNVASFTLAVQMTQRLSWCSSWCMSTILWPCCLEQQGHMANTKFVIFGVGHGIWIPKQLVSSFRRYRSSWCQNPMANTKNNKFGVGHEALLLQTTRPPNGAHPPWWAPWWTSRRSHLPYERRDVHHLSFMVDLTKKSTMKHHGASPKWNMVIQRVWNFCVDVCVCVNFFMLGVCACTNR